MSGTEGRATAYFDLAFGGRGSALAGDSVQVKMEAVAVGDTVLHRGMGTELMGTILTFAS